MAIDPISRAYRLSWAAATAFCRALDHTLGRGAVFIAITLWLQAAPDANPIGSIVVGGMATAVWLLIWMLLREGIRLILAIGGAAPAFIVLIIGAAIPWSRSILDTLTDAEPDQSPIRAKPQDRSPASP